MRYLKLIIISFMILFSGALSLSASDFEGKDDDFFKKSKIRFHGKSQEDCFFVLVKTGYFYKSGNSDGSYFPLSKFPPKSMLVNDFGVLYQYDRKNAMGLSLNLMHTDECTKYAVKVQYRRWLNREVSLDLSSGIILPGDESWGHHNNTGFISTISFDVRNLFTIDLLYEKFSYDYTTTDYSNWSSPNTITTSRNSSSLYMGISGNSYLSPVVTALWLIPLLVQVANY